MSLSATEIASLIDAVNVKIADGTIQKVFESDEETIVFQIRVPGETLNLLFSVGFGLPRFCFVDAKPKQPQTPTPFTMACRKYLTGRFDPASVVPDDRIVRWKVGDHWFIAELTNHPVMAICDAEWAVVAHTPNGPTRVRSGSKYQAPHSKTESSSDDRFDGDLIAATRFLEASAAEIKLAELRLRVAKSLRRGKKKQRRLKKNLEADLQKCVDAESFQNKGTLLQQAFDTHEKGRSVVVVTDYYNPNLAEVEIEIDPAKSLQENIARYFHHYKRLTNAAERVLARLDSVEVDIAEIETCLAAVDTASLPELESIEQRAIASKWITPKQTRKNPRRETKILPYREFVASSGAKIWVGRGAKHNDALTTKFTRGKDVWMHARDWAGAHVVLKATLDKATSEDLVDAAVLAAHFSKGSKDSVVEVSYTEGKHVRKPKGAAPGLVTVSGAKTLVVKPDDPRLSRLLGNE